jgi:hypothetical protein
LFFDTLIAQKATTSEIKSERELQRKIYKLPAIIWKASANNASDCVIVPTTNSAIA